MPGLRKRRLRRWWRSRSPRVATCNAKGTRWDEGKDPAPVRCRRAFRKLRRPLRRRVSLIGWTEWADNQRAALPGWPWWAHHQATRNEHASGGHSRGNGASWSRLVWKRLEVDELEIADGVGTVHLPVIVLKHRWTRRVVAVIVNHWRAGRGPAPQRARRRTSEAVWDEVQRQHELGRVVVPLGDLNGGGEILAALDGDNHGPDHLRALGATLTDFHVHHDIDGPDSDHPAVSARLRLDRTPPRP